MILLVHQGEFKPKRIKESLDVVFARRKTHELPDKINPPPDNWKPVFEKMAKELSFLGAGGILFRNLN